MHPLQAAAGPLRNAARAAASAGSGFDAHAFSRLTDADLRPVVLRDFQVCQDRVQEQGLAKHALK